MSRLKMKNSLEGNKFSCIDGIYIQLWGAYIFFISS